MKRLRAALQLSYSHRTAKRLGLCLTQTFFLWMFFAAGGLERLAEQGLISGPPGTDVKRIAFDFAARWRHGMTDGWPLYMPGFFVTAIAIWFWVYGLTWRRIVTEYAAITAAAICAALLLSLYSTGFVVDAFQSQTKLRCEGQTQSITGRVIVQGLFTLMNWSSFVGASQLCLMQKSFRPFLLPAGLSLVLIVIRPFTADEFTAFWVRQALQGEIVAIFSALLIPALSVLFLWTLPVGVIPFCARPESSLRTIRAGK
jgi:hypothetical protein